MEVKSSVSKVQKSVGSYRFRIEGYSGLSTKVGDSIESPEFLLCGYQWQLRIFPGGSLDSHKGYISYYLASKSNKLARASYKLSVCNQIAGADDESFASSGVRVFEAKGVQVDGWGRDKFMLNQMLNDAVLGYCINDVVIFKVDITVCGELEPSIITIIDNDTSFSEGYTLDRSLGTLLSDQNAALSDLDIIAGSPSASSTPSPSPSSSSSQLDKILASSLLRPAKKGVKQGADSHSFTFLSKEPAAHTTLSFDSSSRSEEKEEQEEQEEVGTSNCGYLKRRASVDDNWIGGGAGVSGTANKCRSRDKQQVETIKAHRCLLMARSPVFRAMLGRDMQERRTGVVRIPDFEPEIVREFLLFLYTDNLSGKTVMQDHCVPLLSIAMKYEVRGLVKICEGYLASQISEDNVVRILLVADEYAAFGLKDDALNFIAHHSEAVYQQKDFQDLQGEVLAEATAVIEYAARKKTCMGAIIDKDRRFSGPCAIM